MGQPHRWYGTVHNFTCGESLEMASRLEHVNARIDDLSDLLEQTPQHGEMGMPVWMIGCFELPSQPPARLCVSGGPDLPKLPFHILQHLSHQPVLHTTTVLLGPDVHKWSVEHMLLLYCLCAILI